MVMFRAGSLNDDRARKLQERGINTPSDWCTALYSTLHDEIGLAKLDIDTVDTDLGLTDRADNKRT